jgi:CRP/FNR family transcriptional regulator, cyclic AMP receptor protein
MPTAKSSPQAADSLDLAALAEPLRALAECGVVRKYRKGTILIEEGEAGDTLYIILSGRLRSYAVSPAGREITYGIYGPGEYLGEMSLDGGPRSASVEVLESSLCSAVARHTLEQFIEDHPQFAMFMLRQVIRKARAATMSAKQMALNDVYGRLALLLDSLAKPLPDGSRLVAERLTHQQMAALLGCSREMVSRLMKDLERGGYVLPKVRGWVVAPTLPKKW